MNWRPGEIADAVLYGVQSASPDLGLFDEHEVSEIRERGDLPWTQQCAYSFTIAMENGQTFEVVVHEVFTGDKHE